MAMVKLQQWLDVSDILLLEFVKFTTKEHKLQSNNQTGFNIGHV